MKLEIDIAAQALGARRGSIKTTNGVFQTPVFMPVGTRGAIKTIAPHNYKELGAEIVLGNTYHLMLRPGADLIDQMGGLAKFTGWQGLTLTDSGGYQVFSLKPKFDETGVYFRSTYDGDLIHFTPEDAVKVQEKIGADIQMVLDVCSALPASFETLKDAVEKTYDWAKRAKAAHDRTTDQALFGIVQGGDNEQLRIESAGLTTSLDFDGYAVGGVSVGETREAMIRVVDIIADNNCLPENQPRYLMGVGDPVGIIESIMRGIDMFDCVLPSRLARHGVLLTWQGKLHIRRQDFKLSEDPIDKDCPCQVCATYTRGYLRHLTATKETSAAYLCTLHNLAWMFDFVSEIRKAIETSPEALIALRNRIVELYGE